jgi:predicted phage terminase large subunit-like protein
MNQAEYAYLAATRNDLKVFLLQAFATIYPGKVFLDNWHIDAIVYCLEQAIEGKNQRLIINLPPRQLKSFVASVVLPAFILGVDPTARIICISYSDELAKALSRDFKRLVESAWYRKVFANVKPTKSTENEFATDQGGSRFATSVGGTLTGRGGDFIIIDDPIKPEDALSDKTRQSTNEWFRSTLLSRLDDKQRSVLILVMQRLHVNDLTGFIEAGGGFHELSLSAIATQDEDIPLSLTESYLREEGEALHPERENVETLEAIRDQIGPLNFAAQYQQRPESPEGATFKREWLQLINEPPTREPGGLLCVSIDSALSTSETADYSAVSLIYSDKRGHYVLSAERGRWDYETLRHKALEYVRRYGRDIWFIVEAAGSGISLISFLRKSGFRCFHHYPRDDKSTRAAYAVPIVHAGRVFIVNKEGKNGWVEPFINEVVTFPQARFDDQVDSLVQVLLWAEPRVNPAGRFYTLAFG